MKRTLLAIGLDLGFLLIAFALVHTLNYGHLQVSATSRDVLGTQAAVLLGVSLLTGKYTRIFKLDRRRAAWLVFKIGVALLFLLSLVIVGLQWMHFSRAMAYGTILVLVALELAVPAAFLRPAQPLAAGASPAPAAAGDRKSTIHLLLMGIDGLLLLAAFAAATYLKHGAFVFFHPYDDMLLFLLGLWLGGSLITSKFDRQNFNDIFSAMGPAIKTVLFMAAGLAVWVYLLRVGTISRFHTFGPLAVFLALEFLVFCLYVSYRQHGQPDGDIEDAATVRQIIGTRVPLAPMAPCPATDPVAEKLQHALDFFDPRVFQMLGARVPLAQINRCNCALVSTDNLFNLDVLDDERMQLIINLHKLNDIRWFNRYLLLAHRKLVPGGYIMGKAHTITTHRAYFREHYSRYLGALFYALSFVWGRVFPKLPWLQKFYFSVTQGRNRMVSRAEILGRLCFCGFRILEDQEFGNRFYFIAQKTHAPSDNTSPTYGPLVRLRRSGLGGRPVTVYKFRTMYPYSEFLQEYIYAHNQLAEGGKFKDDFRVTGWGAFMRRTWLDELPMLFNWLRGDLQIVGVRPLSSQYQQLYDADLRALRQKVKPGLLPPFYADMPKTLEDIMASERRYIQAYLQRPMRTQIVYLCKGVWNIVVRRRRSA